MASYNVNFFYYDNRTIIRCCFFDCHIISRIKSFYKINPIFDVFISLLISVIILILFIDYLKRKEINS